MNGYESIKELHHLPDCRERKKTTTAALLYEEITLGSIPAWIQYLQSQIQCLMYHLSHHFYQTTTLIVLFFLSLLFYWLFTINKP